MTETALSSKPKVAGKSVLALLGCLAALLIFEVTFRIVAALSLKPNPWNDRPSFYPMPESARSMQGPTRSPMKIPSSFRIAAVGDSFTFGPDLEFDDAYPARLERWLNLNDRQPKVEVINDGIPGRSTVQEIDDVKRVLAQGADLVLLNVTLNDPEVYPLTKERRDELFGAPYLNASWLRLLPGLKFILERIHATRTHDLTINYYNDLFENDRTWPTFSQALIAIHDLTEHSQKPLVVFVFPLFDFPFDDRYPLRSVHQKLGQFLEQQHIQHVDLLNAYRGIPPERLQTKPGADAHPNEIAHRIAAEAMFRYIKNHKMVPEAALPKHRFKKRTALYQGSFTLPPVN